MTMFTVLRFFAHQLDFDPIPVDRFQRASITYFPNESARDEVGSSTGAEPTERGSDGSRKA
jgi:hypothetical protein